MRSINFTPGELEEIQQFAKNLSYDLASAPLDKNGRAYPYTVTILDGMREPAVWITVKDGEALIQFARDENEKDARDRARRSLTEKFARPDVLPCDAKDDAR